MLMVVFGAGASYDSVPSRRTKVRIESRPPLANQLFEDRSFFVSAMKSFPRCQPIIPYLQNPPQDVSIEQVLQNLQAEAQQYQERHSQLAAVRFYLQYMMWEFARRWKDEAKGITNYKTLLDQIELWRKPTDRVCLVTFNYEGLIEEAMPGVGVNINALSDYIKSDAYKLIKLHGSVNWWRKVDTPIESVASQNPWPVAHELIDKAPNLSLSESYVMVPQGDNPMGDFRGEALFPAVAIPLETKKEYECPTEHIEALRSFIPEVTKMLIIGWRATETHFLQLLADNQQYDVRVRAVSGDENEARDALERMEKAGVKGKFSTVKGGFTDFILRRGGDDLFSS